jgi:hypothetical protein
MEGVEMLLLIGIVLIRLFGMFGCATKAEELNRSVGGWGFLGFMMPIVSMIIVYCLKPKIKWHEGKNNKEIERHSSMSKTNAAEQYYNAAEPNVPTKMVNKAFEDLPNEIQQEGKTPANYQDDVKKYENLRLIKGLLDDGILTQEEFDKEKQRILENG